MIYTIEIKQGENKRSYTIETKTPLLFMNDISDEVLIVNGKAKLFRRLGVSKYAKTYVLNKITEEPLVRGGDTKVILYDGDNEVSILGTNGRLYIKYMVKNDFNTTFATKVELGTSITQTNQRITLEASKKVGKDEVISRINQSPEGIGIYANKLDFRGKTFNLTSEDMSINSNNFSVDKWGNMVANNANFSGNIKGSSISGGRITGTTVNAASINGGSISGAKLSGGSIRIGKNFTVESDGRAQLSNSTGYVSLLNTTDPYVSALNVARRRHAISFRSGTTQGNAGTQLASIGLTSGNDSFLTLSSNVSGVQLISANGANVYVWARVNLVAKNGASCWAEGNGVSGRIQTDGGLASSKILKKNIKPFPKDKYQKALNVLNKLNIYDYEYKYNLYNKRKQYGFIIDEIEEIEGNQDFFDFHDEYAKVKDGDKLDPSVIDDEDFDKNAKNIIHYKQYDNDVLDKYLLTCLKAQQMQIEELNERIKKLEEKINDRYYMER